MYTFVFFIIFIAMIFIIVSTIVYVSAKKTDEIKSSEKKKPMNNSENILDEDMH